MTRLATIGVVLVAAAAVVLLNVVLLNRAAAGNDKVGRLTPTAKLIVTPSTPSKPPAVVVPPSGPIEGSHRDD